MEEVSESLHDIWIRKPPHLPSSSRGMGGQASSEDLFPLGYGEGTGL